MSCEDIRELLPEHLLGVLEPDADQAVRRHLRGCGGCRAELASLGEGLATFARAAHQTDPPESLRERVFAVLQEERADPEVVPHRSRLTGALLAQAAVVAALAGALAWGAVATVAGSHASARAGRYEAFLDALGGKDVRVATLSRTRPHPIEGSAIVYDSEVGQSWVLVLARSPGLTGKVRVLLTSPADRIELHAMEFDSHGEASTWLVTSANLARYDHVRLIDTRGNIVVAGQIGSD